MDIPTVDETRKISEDFTDRYKSDLTDKLEAYYVRAITRAAANGHFKLTIDLNSFCFYHTQDFFLNEDVLYEFERFLEKLVEKGYVVFREPMDNKGTNKIATISWTRNTI